MSTAQKIGKSKLPPAIKQELRVGNLGGKKVVLANNQTSKVWFIIAIIIGALLIIGLGSFGSMGLLHSHGLISLPQWLTVAIGTVGQTPYLWTMTTTGIVVGAALITFGAYKIHRGPKNVSGDLKEKIKTSSPSVANTEEPVEEDASNSENYLQIIANRSEPKFDFPRLPDRFYKTLAPKDFNSAPVGDYCFVDVPKSKMKLKVMKIKGSNKDLQIVVRESTKNPGYYRSAYYDENQKYHESKMLFSAAQLAAMTRHAVNPEHGIQVSSLTAIVWPGTGLVIFKSENESEKKYFLVNRAGALEETSLKTILQFCNKLGVVFRAK